MKNLAFAALLAGLMLSSAPAALAQSTPGGVAVSGIAIANRPAIVAGSNAYKAAAAQLPVTYKAQIDQANTRRNQIAAQLKPLYDKFEADQKAPKPDTAALRAQAAQIQQLEQSGEREMQQMVEPVNVAQQYVLEQIGDKLDQATQAAMTKRKVTVVLDAQSVLKADQVYNLNQDILNEVNVLIPTALLVPPAGWLPRAQREAAAQQAAQQAAAQAAQGGATAPATPPKQPSGR